MYSLLSASVLAVDLVRAAGGVAAAEVLLGALALDVDRAPAAADVVDLPLAEARERARRRSAEVRNLEQAFSQVGRLFARAPGRVLPRVHELRGATRLLSSTPIGRPADLARLLHDEMLPTRPDLALAAEDALTAALLDTGLGAGDAATLRAAWSAVTGVMPAVAVLDGLPGAAEVRIVLDRCAALEVAEVAALEQAHRAGPAGRGLAWSTALHQACVATLDAGLVRPMACAHVAAGRVLAGRSDDSRVQVVAAMPAVVGHLQVAALGPLAPAGLSLVLSDAWEQVLG